MITPQLIRCRKDAPVILCGLLDVSRKGERLSLMEAILIEVRRELIIKELEVVAFAHFSQATRIL